MIFSDLYKSPKSPFSKLRHLSNSNSNANSNLNTTSTETQDDLEDYGDPDLVSRDKAKQKEAVRRYLAKNIRNDWDFAWPHADKDAEAVDKANVRAAAIRRKIVAVEQVGLLQPAETFASPLPPQTVSLAAVSAAVANLDENTDSDSDDSTYSTISEDAINLRPRAEWTSDFSEDDRAGTYYQRMPVYVHSPFRFDSPDAVGANENATPEERRAKARRDVRAEMTWNDGLACFNARRDAWTGAHTVRVKPAKPVSASPPRRGLFRFHSKTDTLPLSPVTSNSRHSQYSQQSQQSQQSADVATPITSDDGAEDLHVAKPRYSFCNQEYAVETLVPVAHPLLPPSNPMRQSITPALYLSLYDKLVIGLTQPSCPINLSDMIRSCVAGWKRDNEWPVQPPPMPTLRILPSGTTTRRRKERAQGQGPFHRMRMLSKQPSVVLPTTTPATVGAAAPEVDEKGDHDGSQHGIRRSLQRVLGLNGHA